MTIRFDSNKRRTDLRATVECPACGRQLESAGLAQPGDLLRAHLRYSCAGRETARVRS